MNDKKEKKVKNPDDKVGFGKLLRWQSSSVSVALNTLLLAQFGFYCSDVLGIDTVVVGTLLLISKLVDGVTDLIIGVIIDKTETKWGKGRPYEIFMLFLWAATWALFSTPTSFPAVAKYAWIFIMYTFVNAVCKTCLNGNNTVYLVRAFKTRTQQIKATAYGSFFTMAGGFAFNIIFPQLMVKIGNNHAEWSKTVLLMGIPLTLIGLVRILTIPEKYNKEADVHSEQLKFKDVIQLFKNNKYVLAVCVIAFLYSLVTSLGVGTYYFKYILGNVGLMSVTSAFTVLGLPMAFILPRWANKYGMAKTCMIAFFISAAAGLVMFVLSGNFIAVLVTMLVVSLCSVPYTMMGAVFVMELSDYNEYNNQPRMEGTIGAVKGLTEKIGSAFGAFVLGAMLKVAGYVTATGDAVVTQPDSAINMIRFMATLFPMIMYLLLAFLFKKTYASLDEQKPMIQAELAKRREAAAAEAAAAN